MRLYLLPESLVYLFQSRAPPLQCQHLTDLAVCSSQNVLICAHANISATRAHGGPRISCNVQQQRLPVQQLAQVDLTALLAASHSKTPGRFPALLTLTTHYKTANQLGSVRGFWAQNRASADQPISQSADQPINPLPSTPKP